MKRIFSNLLYCFVALVPILLSSCQDNEELKTEVLEGEKPNTEFTNSEGSLTVNFTNTSTNAESYYWQFGDGTSSIEESPEHTYVAAGIYNVALKTNSQAGYSSTVNKDVNVAGPASAFFSYEPTFQFFVYFTAAGSANVSSLSWDFGDGTAVVTDMSVEHEFTTEGTYTVTLTVTGLLGDVNVMTKEIEVATAKINLLQGGGMEASAAGFWTNWGSQNDNPPVFGYTGDMPSAGVAPCLRFPDFTAPADGSKNQMIYQPVQVIAGGKYELGAQLKIPAGGYQCYIQFYVSTDANTWIENSSDLNTNHFLCLNTWHGWNSTAIDGGLLEAVKANGGYGIGVSTDGIYTAAATGTVYIGIQVGSWSGYSNGDVLIDDVSFVRVE